MYYLYLDLELHWIVVVSGLSVYTTLYLKIQNWRAMWLLAEYCDGCVGVTVSAVPASDTLTQYRLVSTRFSHLKPS